jgi:hypothetical protein
MNSRASVKFQKKLLRYLFVEGSAKTVLSKVDGFETDESNVVWRTNYRKVMILC